MRLAVVYAMKGKANNFLAWFGIKCSSWVAVNAGTSKRTICSSTGDRAMKSVREANQLLERTTIFEQSQISTVAHKLRFSYDILIDFYGTFEMSTLYFI